MPTFSDASLAKLSTCHPDLQRLCHELIKSHDFTILWGFRNKEQQELAFVTQKSKLAWPDSKHNKVPSLAVDIAPYPVDWSNIMAFDDLARDVKALAASLGIAIVWGGDFKGFADKDHFQLSKVD